MKLKKIIYIIAVSSILMLMAARALTPGISMTEDLGRHLLLGKIIIEKHFVPNCNYLTYTHPAFPFVNHHWLSEVIFYCVFSLLGYKSLIIIKTLLFVLILAIPLITVKIKNRIWLFWLSGLLAVFLLGYRVHIRPEIFSYLGVAIYYWCFIRINEKVRWPRFAIVAYALLWANAHIYFIFGIAMCAAFSLERILKNKKNLKSELLWFFSVVIVSIVTPFGLKTLLFPFQILLNYEVTLTENISPLGQWKTVINPMMIALPFFSVIVVAAIILKIVRWKRKDAFKSLKLDGLAILLTAIMGLAFAWLMARNSPLLALTGLPVIIDAFCSRGLKEQKNTIFNMVSYSALVIIFAINYFLLFAIVNGSFSRIFPSPIGPTSFGVDDFEKYINVKKIIDKYNLKVNVFSDYNLGSLVEFNLYPQKGYVDNRPEAFPGAFWRAELNPALALGQQWYMVKTRRNINMIYVGITAVKEQYIGELMRRSNTWSLIYLDGICAVWLKNIPKFQTVISKLKYDNDKFKKFDEEISNDIKNIHSFPFWKKQIVLNDIIYKIYALICVNQKQLAWKHLEHIYKLFPNYQIVHELMRACVVTGKENLIENILRKQAMIPLSSKMVIDYGYMMEAKGKKEEAKKIYKKGLMFFPLSDNIKRQLERINDEEYYYKLINSYNSNSLFKTSITL